MNAQEKADTEADVEKVEEAPVRTALPEKVPIESNRRLGVILLVSVLVLVVVVALAVSLSLLDGNEEIQQAQATTTPSPFSTQAPTDIVTFPRTSSPSSPANATTFPTTNTTTPASINWSFPVKPGPDENASIVPVGSPIFVTPSTGTGMGKWQHEYERYKADITSNGNRIIVADEHFQFLEVPGRRQTGIARVLDWNGTEWEEIPPLKLGSRSDGVDTDSFFGSMVAIDFSGSVATVFGYTEYGDPTLHRFEIVDGIWKEMPPYRAHDIGMSLDLSGTGARAILGNNDNYGTSYLFEWDTLHGEWKLLDRFNRRHFEGCETGYETFGEISSISADGNVVASVDPLGKCIDCGSPIDNCQYSPFVHVARWNGSNLVPKGRDILAVEYSTSFALSGDGSRVAVWSHFYVSTLEWNGQDWGPMGEPFVAGNFGHTSMSFSYDGTWLALGMPESYGSFGAVRIMYWNTEKNKWAQVAGDVVGGKEGIASLFGTTVRISADANRFIATGNGYARVYDILT